MAFKESYMGTEIVLKLTIGKRHIYKYLNHSEFGLPKYCVFHGDFFLGNAMTLSEAQKIAREIQATKAMDMTSMAKKWIKDHGTAPAFQDELRAFAQWVQTHCEAKI